MKKKKKKGAHAANAKRRPTGHGDTMTTAKTTHHNTTLTSLRDYRVLKEMRKALVKYHTKTSIEASRVFNEREESN